MDEEEPANVEWHPNAVDLYKRKVADLQAALNSNEMVRQEATAALRALVDRIVAYPAAKRGQFELELHGQLAAALNFGKHGNGGGGRGIRTLDRALQPYNGLANRRLQPLGHPSAGSGCQPRRMRGLSNDLAGGLSMTAGQRQVEWAGGAWPRAQLALQRR